MGLKEIAVDGVYFSPLLLYALLGVAITLLLRLLLYRLFRHNASWLEAWFDISLFVTAMAACAFLSSTLT